MKFTRVARNRVLKLSAVGLYAAVAAIAACSSDPAAPTHIGGAGAAGAATAGAATAGAATAGAATAGSTAAGSGGDATAGAPAGGGGAGGDATAGAPGAGAAGAPPVPKAFCAPDNPTVQPRKTLPYPATEGFIPSGYDSAALTQIGQVKCTAGEQSAAHVNADAAHDLCSVFTYTPDAVAPSYAGVRYIRMFDTMFTHAPVCIADGVTYVNFWAKGAAGGEKVTFTAQGAAEIEFPLTNAWKQYQIPMTGVVYNTDATGVELGFYWKVVPPVGGTAVLTKFYVDHIEWVNTGVVGGGGGAGGMGGGGAGGGGAGGGGAGGTAGGGAGGMAGG